MYINIEIFFYIFKMQKSKIIFSAVLLLHTYFYCLEKRVFILEKLIGFSQTNVWIFTGHNSQSLDKTLASIYFINAQHQTQWRLRITKFVARCPIARLVVLRIGLPRANVLRLYSIPISFKQHIQESGGQEGAEQSKSQRKKSTPSANLNNSASSIGEKDTTKRIANNIH